MNEKLVIKQLLKIATKQQEIIAKLAQAQDPNVEYLRRVAVVAGANLNVNVTESHVVPLEGGNTGTSALPNGYTLHVKGVPSNLREKYIATVKAQVKAQKPDQPNLSDNLSIIFDE